MHFPVTLPERPARPPGWLLCLRLIPSFAANYFMPSFELSVEIQLSDCLWSLHNWGGDKGRGREDWEGWGRDRKSWGKHFLAVRYEKFHWGRTLFALNVGFLNMSTHKLTNLKKRVVQHLALCLFVFCVRGRWEHIYHSDVCLLNIRLQPQTFQIN